MSHEPIVESIKIERKKLQELESLLQRSKLTDKNRYDIIRKYVGGGCVICGNIPTKKVIYNANGAQVIERYCDVCFKKWKR